MKNPSKESDDDYRDDPDGFGRSSDLAQTGRTSVTTGGGPGDSSKDPAGIAGSRGNHAGSQEDWRGPQAATIPADPGADAAAADGPAAADDPDAEPTDASPTGRPGSSD